MGEIFQPFERVGIYVPGGTAPLVSTANMTVALAKAADVSEIVVCTPPAPGGSVSPALLYALHQAGATEVYKVGGAQALAAMAIGTHTISPVVKVFGPGNSYVVEAKRQLFGLVAVDLLPGPSEILVLCDSSAKPAWIATDLLAQAEHGPDSVMILISDCKKTLAAVQTEVEKTGPDSEAAEAFASSSQKRLYLCAGQDHGRRCPDLERFCPGTRFAYRPTGEKPAAQN